MKFAFTTRNLFLCSVAALALAACTNVDTASSPGDGTPVVVNPPPSGGGGGGGGGAAFAGRSTLPRSQGDCAPGLTFVSNVAVPNSGGAFTNFCALGGSASGSQIGKLAGTLTGTVNIPFSADPILISGTVFLGNPTDAINDQFTFAPGQKFISQGVPGVVDLLVVSRGTKVTMQGTSTNPIVFTSMQDYADDGQPNGSSGTAEWGGIAINGKAPLNECTVDTTAAAGTDACRQNGEGGSGVFGGGDANDSSGVFEYVRVQHAGFPFTPTNELNSFALQGVGAGTTFRYIQVHKAEDDGFEWFGGTVNADHLVVTGAKDDSLDWTDGWNGRLQYALVIQKSSNDNGIEGDNNGDTVNNALPRSTPHLSNITLIGEGDASGEGIQLRAGTGGAVVNTIVANFGEGFEFNPPAAAAPISPDPTVNSILLEGNRVNFAGAGSTLFATGANNRTSDLNTLNGFLPGANALSTTAINPTTIDPAFEPAVFVGAFGPGDTVGNNWTTGWTIDVNFSSGCPAGTSLATETPASAGFTGRTESRICVINAPVAGNVRLTAGNLYRLDGSTFIGPDRGANPASPIPGTSAASLTIDAGVTVFANQASPDLVDLLVVSRGSQLFVNGTASAPVVMTSRADLVNGGVLRATATNEWGGLAVNGRAPLNECTVNPSATPGTVACEQNGEGGSGRFGGATFDDNSGTMRYFQIRYAGKIFSATNELNSIAFQGVGSGTVTEYVQIINGGDDGIEWFGGANSVRYAVVFGANDDSIDWTDGWVGTLQYAIVKQGGAVNVGDNGIEGDNNGDTVNNALPRSTPIVTNITLIGDRGASDEGIQVRAGTGGAVLNTIVNNFGQGLEFNPPSAAAAISPDPIVSGLRLVDNVAQFAGSGSALFAAGTNNEQNAASTLTAPAGFTLAILPGANEDGTGVDPVAVCNTVFTGATFSPCSKLDAVTYPGAVSGPSDTWWQGWTIGF